MILMLFIFYDCLLPLDAATCFQAGLKREAGGTQATCVIQSRHQGVRTSDADGSASI